MARSSCRSAMIAAATIALTASVSTLAGARDIGPGEVISHANDPVCVEAPFARDDQDRQGSQGGERQHSYGGLNEDRQRSYCVTGVNDLNAQRQRSYGTTDEPQQPDAATNDPGRKNAGEDVVTKSPTSAAEKK